VILFQKTHQWLRNKVDQERGGIGAFSFVHQSKNLCGYCNDDAHITKDCPAKPEKRSGVGAFFSLWLMEIMLAVWYYAIWLVANYGTDLVVNYVILMVANIIYDW
jgi:hypothetical protein